MSVSTRSSKRRKVQSTNAITIIKPAVEHGWIVDAANISQSFNHLQDAAVELINKTNGGMMLETSAYEILALQNILLLRPGQNSESMIKVYGDQLLDSMLSSPEEKIHLRWTNMKDSVDEKERPDGIAALKTQSRRSRNYGHGVAKIAEARDNYSILVWDLCRLAYCSKALINSSSASQAFAFQVKGHNITFHVTELAHDGLYTMCEVGHIEVPHSVATLDRMVTPKYLRTLMQVKHSFENLKSQVVDDKISQMKRDGPSLSQLEKLLSLKDDRNLPCTLRF